GAPTLCLWGPPRLCRGARRSEAARLRRRRGSSPSGLSRLDGSGARRRPRGDAPRPLRRHPPRGRGRRLVIRLLLACLVLGSLTAVARAHPLAPSGLRVVEGEGELVTLRFRTPVMRPVGTDVTPLYPQACSLTEPPRAVTAEGGAVEILFSLRCPGGIVGETFGVRGLTEARTDVLWDLRRANGARASGLLHAGAATFVVPEDA